MFIDKDELLGAIEREYGNLNNDRGCYCSVDGEHVWLSIKRIVDIIEDMDEYDYDDIYEE